MTTGIRSTVCGLVWSVSGLPLLHHTRLVPEFHILNKCYISVVLFLFLQPKVYFGYVHRKTLIVIHRIGQFRMDKLADMLEFLKITYMPTYNRGRSESHTRV